MKTVLADVVKQYVIKRVEEYKTGEDPSGLPLYAGDKGQPASLAAFCDMVFIKYVIDRLPDDKPVRSQWIEYINSFQDPSTGYFMDKHSIWVPKERIKPWLFGFALRALNALGGQPRYPLRFLSEWSTPEKLKAWILSGNDVMHLGIVYFRYVDKKKIPYDFEKTFFDILDTDVSRCDFPNDECLIGSASFATYDNPLKDLCSCFARFHNTQINTNRVPRFEIGNVFF